MSVGLINQSRERVIYIIHVLKVTTEPYIKQEAARIYILPVYPERTDDDGS